MSLTGEIDAVLGEDTRETIVHGGATFYAEEPEENGDVWFRSATLEEAFCRSEDGWYCTLGGRGHDPRAAIIASLHLLRDRARTATRLLGGKL